MTQLKTIGILCVFVLTIAMVSSPLAYHAFAQPLAHKTTNENVKLLNNTEKNHLSQFSYLIKNLKITRTPIVFFNFEK